MGDEEERDIWMTVLVSALGRIAIFCVIAALVGVASGSWQLAVAAYLAMTMLTRRTC